MKSEIFFKNAYIITINSELSTIAEFGFEKVNSSHINTIYSIINGISNLPNQALESFAATITTLVMLAIASIKESDSAESNENPIVILYFFQIFCQRMENEWKLKSNAQDEQEVSSNKLMKPSKNSKKSISNQISSNQYDWDSERSHSISLLKAISQLESSSMWSMGILQENFYLNIWKYALQLLEDKLSDTVHHECILILTHCIQIYVSHQKSLQGIISTMIGSISQCEHRLSSLSKDISEIGSLAPAIFISEILKEIGNMEMKEKSKVKNFISNINVFLVTLTERCPHKVSNSMAYVIDLIDNDVYIIRYSLYAYLNAHIFNIIIL